DDQPFDSGTTVSAEGEHRLSAAARDCAGNSRLSELTFTIDQTPPAIAISGLDDAQCGASDVTPVVTATDPNLTDVTLTLNDQPFASGTPVTADGSYVLVAIAHDGAGNETVRQVTFVI